MMLNVARTLLPPRVRRGIGRLVGLTHLRAGRELPINHRKRSTRQIPHDVAYAIEITKSYFDQIQRIGQPIQGCRILELGPGHHFAPNLALASYGAQVTVADRFLAPWDNKYHPHFYRAFEMRWKEELVAVKSALAQRSHSAGRITMYPHPAEALCEIGARTQDVVLSNAVLEHVFSLPDVCQEMARITAPGGYNIHQIDFRDHRDFSRPLEFLLLSDETFLQEFVGSHGERGNRLRASEVCDVFQTNGFKLVNLEINCRTDDAYLRDFIPRLQSSASRFQLNPHSDLSVLGARFTFRRLNDRCATAKHTAEP